MLSRIWIFFIPDPNFFHPGSRIHIKLFPSSWKYDPGGSSRIRILIFTHPGSRIQGSKRYRIPDPNPQHWYQNKFLWQVKILVDGVALCTFKNFFFHRGWPLVFLAMASAASLPELCAATRIFLMMRPPMEWPTKMTGRLPTPAASRRSRISSDLSSRNRRELD